MAVKPTSLQWLPPSSLISLLVQHASSPKVCVFGPFKKRLTNPSLEENPAYSRIYLRPPGVWGSHSLRGSAKSGRLAMQTISPTFLGLFTLKCSHVHPKFMRKLKMPSKSQRLTMVLIMLSQLSGPNKFWRLLWTRSPPSFTPPVKPLPRQVAHEVSVWFGQSVIPNQTSDRISFPRLPILSPALSWLS